MANKLGKAVIPAAMDSKSNKFDLSENHLTTTGFFQFQPVYIREVVPNSTIEISNELISRACPMTDPAFVDVKFRLNHFFVPMRTLWKSWNSFITATPDPNKKTIYNSVPKISNKNLVEYFIGSVGSSLYLGPLLTSLGNVEPAQYDIVYTTYSSAGVVSFTYYNFTYAGRRVYKILKSLGYDILFVTDNRPTGSGRDGSLFHDYSALPLLAAVRVYLDWYYSSQYAATTSLYNDIFALFTEHGPITFTSTILSQIFTLLYTVTYEDDYFVSSNDEATTPIGNAGVTFYDPSTDQNAVVGTQSFDTPAIYGELGPLDNISQYLVDLLHSVTDYFKRRQISGNRVADRYLTQFGIKLNDSKSDRSTYISNDVYQLQIGDVVSSSETTGANLGDYAGKGFAAGGNKSVKFETDEFGFYVVVMSVIPKVGYYQGVSPHVDHVGLYDFFNAEFDGIGYSPVPVRHLLLKKHGNVAGRLKGSFSKIFGWLPRYSSYKTSLDKMTGDFSLGSITDLKGWHSYRDVDLLYQSTNADDIAHSQNFVNASDTLQYDRLFYSSNAEDKFRVFLRFHVTMYQRMKYLFDTYDFDDGGNDVTINPTGTTLH